MVYCTLDTIRASNNMKVDNLFTIYSFTFLVLTLLELFPWLL